jgi:hypothetical protein
MTEPYYISCETCGIQVTVSGETEVKCNAIGCLVGRKKLEPRSESQFLLRTDFKPALVIKSMTIEGRTVTFEQLKELTK